MITISKRKTNEEFTKELNLINCNIKALDEYIVAKRKIRFKCLICDNIWENTPTNILSGQGCPRCAPKKQAKTHDQFIRELNNVNTNITCLNQYKDAKTKLRFKCLICEHEWNAQPSNILFGTGCPKCARNYKKTHEQFVEELNIKNPNVICLDTYIGANKKIKFHCLICQHVWDATPASVLHGNKCPECNRIKQSITQRKSHEQFIKDSKISNPNITILGKYTTAKSKILCRCNICNYEWQPIADSIVRGHGCPKCCGKDKTTEDFIKEIQDVNPNVYIIGEYIKSSEKILCKCKLCSFEWDSTPNRLQSGIGCPKCKLSHGERKINYFLENNKIKFIPQMKYSGLKGVKGRLLSYDFYLPQYNLLVEYQGEFHDGTSRIQTENDFEIQQEHDKRKKDYAKLHKINLLEIWYYDIDNIEEILNNELFKLNKNINNLKLESVETVTVA